MERISLKEFINNTKGKKLSLPGGGQKGMCVSLVQQYIYQCLGQSPTPRGHAKQWKTSYVKEGLGKVTTTPRYGDIIVYDIGEYGHIAIYIDKTRMYDQNNGYHDNKKAGYGVQLKTKTTYLRPNVALIPDEKEYWTKGVYKLLYKKAWRKTHTLGNNIYRYVNKGTDINVTEIYKQGNRVWGKVGNFWIVICNADGTPQATKTK